ncbi:MAG TPA: hypothetical protein VMG59_12250 [Phycisphaerae bacterium]|nr:hypothetical protein [Phycisphaerae bacterium]
MKIDNKIRREVLIRFGEERRETIEADWRPELVDDVACLFVAQRMDLPLSLVREICLTDAPET